MPPRISIYWDELSECLICLFIIYLVKYIMIKILQMFWPKYLLFKKLKYTFYSTKCNQQEQTKPE